MAKLTKRAKMIAEKVDLNKIYSFSEAITLLKELSVVKFKESLDLAVNLGIDSRKSDQVVRGSVVLPAGTGKKVSVAVFTQSEEQVKAAKDAGADLVGMDDLAQKIKEGEINFDVVISSPDAMRVVGQLGQILGPRGLMPNPKLGTVTPNVGEAVKNAKSGQVRFRADKGGIVHTSTGKIDFSPDDLRKNVLTVMTELKKLKPSTSKGVYIKKVTLSTTMGPGLSVDIASLGE